MKKNNIRFTLFILCIVVLSSITAYADQYNIPKPSFEFYVYDEVGLLDESLKDHIINVNKNLERETGSQIVVSVIDSFNGNDKQLYGTKMLEEWKIGSREKDNGVLIVFSPNDRDIWIEVGYGLEGAIPDTIAYRIVNDTILPEFKNENYNEGISKGFDQILGRIQDEYGVVIDGSVQVEDYRSEGEGEFGRVIAIFIFILIIIAMDNKFNGGRLVYMLLRSSGGSSSHHGGGGSYRGGSSGRSGGGGSSRGSSGGGGRSGGGGAGGSW